MARAAFICACALASALLTKKTAIGQPAVCCIALLCLSTTVSNPAIAFGLSEAFLACYVGLDMMSFLESDMFNVQALSQSSDVGSAHPSHSFLQLCLRHLQTLP